MSVGRITQQTTLSSNLRYAGQQNADLARLQESATSQKSILRPSDDPAGTAKAMALRSSLVQNDQFSRNAKDAQGWLSVADSTLAGATDTLQRVRDLTVQGANGTNGATSNEAIALELEQLKNEMISQANSKYLGRNVFAGTSDTGLAFDPTTYTYNGDASGTVDRLVGENRSVRVDADGAAAFGSGATSVFADIDTIIADLRAGVNIGSHIDKIDTRIKAAVEVRAQVGARQATVIAAEENLLASKTSLTADQSAVEDIDFASVYLELQSAYVVQEATLNVLARVASGPQLQDYL